MKLGVNVDHTATLRQARGTLYPDPVVIAMLAEYAGCHSIVMHLREDRRHVKERDVLLAKETLKVPLNLEMSVNKNIVDFAVNLKPEQVTLVPEKRQELTTEGGLNLVRDYKKIDQAIARLKAAGIIISLFIDPLKRIVNLSKKMSVDIIEINTGSYSEAKTTVSLGREIKKIKETAGFAKQKGFFVAAGHGIDYENVKGIIGIKDIEELNIGHSIICRALGVGMVSAVEEMIALTEASGKKKTLLMK